MARVQFVMEQKLSYYVATSHDLVRSCNDHAYVTLTNRHPALRHIHVNNCVTLHLVGYTGCPRTNVPDFGRVFLMLKYNDITQNTYVQS